MKAHYTKLTPKKRKAFLKHLAQTGFVNQSARLISVSRGAFYKLAKRDPEFKAGWGEALEEHVEFLEAEADRRAVEGVDCPVTTRAGSQPTTRNTVTCC